MRCSQPPLLPSRHAGSFPAFSSQMMSLSKLCSLTSYACFCFCFVPLIVLPLRNHLCCLFRLSCRRLIANSVFSRQRQTSRILKLSCVFAVTNQLHVVAFAFSTAVFFFCALLLSSSSPRHSFCGPFQSKLAQPRAPAKAKTPLPLHKVNPPRPPKIGPELLSSFFFVVFNTASTH